MSHSSLESIFYPRSVALVGIKLADSQHWTRTFLESVIAFEFPGPIYPVNPRGGEVKGLKVYHRIDDIPGTVDYVICTVPAKAAPGLIAECARKGVKAIHLCTAGFSETGEEEGKRLERELADLARKTGVRLIGPNCMGIYCPESHLSYHTRFPRESGPVGVVCQSGGNASGLVEQASLRGVRFSKVISYGNACDLNESDFLEYFADDPKTSVVALYIEGVKDGSRFRQALQKVAMKKPVVLIKGGMTEGGAAAAASHTGALAGSGTVWDSLCKQSGAIQVYNVEEMADMLVTILFMPVPKGKRGLLVGIGGGASVLITDEFERRGLTVPPLPKELREQIREFTPIAGNILRNPIDYTEIIRDINKLIKAVTIAAQWDGTDFMVGFMRPRLASPLIRPRLHHIIDAMVEVSKECSKPLAFVIEPSIRPQDSQDTFSFINHCVSLGLPVYYSFSDAASAISLMLKSDAHRCT